MKVVRPAAIGSAAILVIVALTLPLAAWAHHNPGLEAEGWFHTPNLSESPAKYYETAVWHFDPDPYTWGAWHVTPDKRYWKGNIDVGTSRWQMWRVYERWWDPTCDCWRLGFDDWGVYGDGYTWQSGPQAPEWSQWFHDRMGSETRATSDLWIDMRMRFLRTDGTTWCSRQMIHRVWWQNPDRHGESFPKGNSNCGHWE